MRISFSKPAVALAVSALLSTLAFARNPADYPLRVHIFEHNSHSHYYHRVLDWVDGEGRANLFENGMPLGFDYSYRCSERLRNSAGFETYLAKWKKRNETLEILLPKLGNASSTVSCDLKVDMKDSAYFRQGNGLQTESPAAYKEWMEKHQYDPEHGKNDPVGLAPEPAGAATGPTQ